MNARNRCFKSLGVLLACWGVGISVSAFAETRMIGPDAFRVAERDLPSVCHIEILFAGTEDSGHCSGTLVGTHEVLTGAHCFGRHFRFGEDWVSVRCGGRSASVARVELPEDSYWRTARLPLPSYDVAKVVLSEGLSLPMARAKSADTFFEPSTGYLKDGVSCWIAGFGAGKNRDLGTLHRADLMGLSVVYDAGVIRMFDPSSELLRTSVRIGDSGGPLVCSYRLPNGSRSVSELVGVVVSYRPHPRNNQQAVDNTFAPVWFQPY